jgi:hypothetical protein
MLFLYPNVDCSCSDEEIIIGVQRAIEFYDHASATGEF